LTRKNIGLLFHIKVKYSTWQSMDRETFGRFGPFFTKTHVVTLITKTKGVDMYIQQRQVAEILYRTLVACSSQFWTLYRIKNPIAQLLVENCNFVAIKAASCRSLKFLHGLQNLNLHSIMSNLSSMYVRTELRTCFRLSDHTEPTTSFLPTTVSENAPCWDTKNKLQITKC
jgi:hypothetical protein